MNLGRLASEAGLRLVRGPAEIEIASLADDSRAVRPGSLFIARRGAAADGHAHVGEAVRNGAVAVVAERDVGTPAGVPLLLTDPAGVGRRAAAFHGRPARSLRVIGVTGTNGKTTTTFLLRAILEAAGVRCGVVGTVVYDVGAGAVPARLTTPGPVALQALLAEARANGLGALAMEVSSHALSLGRVDEVEFAAGVFTNLTPEHLDFHADMEAYFAAKRRLFDLAPRGAVHVGDAWGRRLAAECPDLLTFARAGQSPDRPDVEVEEVRLGLEATRFILRMGGIESPASIRLLGLPNVENALAAAAAARALGVPPEAIVRGLEAAAPPPGRLEVVAAGPSAPRVIVDYAHTPDALERLLETARGLEPRRLVLVFGCGGDRDRTKRPVMGRIASRKADVVFATSDNPRTEDPERILDEVVAGVNGSGAPVRRISDRRAAIRAAIAEAEAGDIVVIAGKGHEDYQILGTTRIRFDDREEARAALEARA